MRGKRLKIWFDGCFPWFYVCNMASRCSTVLFEKLMVAVSLKKFATFCGTQGVIRVRFCSLFRWSIIPFFHVCCNRLDIVLICVRRRENLMSHMRTLDRSFGLFSSGPY